MLHVHWVFTGWRLTTQSKSFPFSSSYVTRLTAFGGDSHYQLRRGDKKNT